MRIQHNIMAMNAYRNYNANTSALSKNLEKLSSGYKINRAGDDAAGLAISEKMRAQITGLDAAQKNVKDGISLVKTAEGAMQEVQDMLNRMVYLAEQSANGTYDNEVDRANLQKEVDQLRSEIDRIADSANFNGINLLDGSMEKGAVRGAAYEKVANEDILKLLPPELNKGQPVVGKNTITEANGEKARNASFSVKLDNLNAVKDDTEFKLVIGDKELEKVTVKEGMSSEQIAELYDGKTVTLSDDQGNTQTFDITADGKTLHFKAQETKPFEPPKTVSFVSSATQKAEDDIEVTDKETKVMVSAYAEKDGNASATVALSAAVTNLAVSDGDKGNGAADKLDVDKIIAKAKADGLTGDVSIKFDENGKAGLYISDTKIAEDTSAANLATAALATGDYVFNFGDFGKASLTVSTAAVDTQADVIDAGVSISTGLTVSSSPAFETAVTIDEDELKTELEAADLDGLASGNVSVAYNSAFENADGTLGRWEMTAEGKTIGLTATVTNGVLTLTGQAGAIFTVDASKAATGGTLDPTESDYQDTFTNGKVVAALGKEATVTGTINGATQNIQLGTNGADDRVANTTIGLKDYFQKDGTKITGDTTYTVAVGKDSKFKDAKNVIDLTDFEANEVDEKIAATRLTTVAKENNGIFSVGHDNNGNTTLQQLSSAKDSTDMETLKGIASYIDIEVADAKSLGNVNTVQGLTLQIGDTSDTYNQLAVSIGDMHVSALGIDAIDISTQKGAQDAVDVIRNAINQVSSVRGDLGATQNRLEHTANNLSVMAENIQDAESTIRDTDVAQEMMAYTKNNILIQSAQAMLAQANAVHQGVLQLLG